MIWVTPNVNGHTLKMELDTGSAISTLPLETYKETFPNTPLVDTTAILKTYSGEKITPEGKLLADYLPTQERDSVRRPSTQ